MKNWRLLFLIGSLLLVAGFALWNWKVSDFFGGLCVGSGFSLAVGSFVNRRQAK